MKEKNEPIFSKEINSIPSDWKLEKLGDLFEFKNGINASKESYGNGVKFINVMEVIYNNSITADLIRGSVVVSDKQLKVYSVNKGDVLFNRTSEITNEVGLAAVYMDDEKIVFGGFVIRGVPKDNTIIDEYKKYCFRSEFVRKQIIIGGQGVVRSNIGQVDLEKIKLPIPPLQEQKAISHILGLIDSIIAQNNNLIAQKEMQKKWLMQQVLTGKKRLKGFIGEWQECHLSDLFTERNETGYTDLDLLSIGAYGIYPQSNSAKRDTSNEDKSKYKRICRGDIGYNTMRMWQGRSALSQLEGIVSPAYTVVSPNEKADGLFFSYLFKTPLLINRFWRNSQGLVDDTLNCKWKDFSIVKTKLPPTKKEQKSIAIVLQTADKAIEVLIAKVELLKEQKNGLMQQLLTGMKRLNK